MIRMMNMSGFTSSSWWSDFAGIEELVISGF